MLALHKIQSEQWSNQPMEQKMRAEMGQRLTRCRISATRGLLIIKSPLQQLTTHQSEMASRPKTLKKFQKTKD